MEIALYAAVHTDRRRPTVEQRSACVSNGHLYVLDVQEVPGGRAGRYTRVDELAPIMAWDTCALSSGGRE